MVGAETEQQLPYRIPRRGRRKRHEAANQGSLAAQDAEGRTHWEQRLGAYFLMASTNAYYHRARVSRLTLAVFEDSGWYQPNYAKASFLETDPAPDPFLGNSESEPPALTKGLDWGYQPVGFPQSTVSD